MYRFTVSPSWSRNRIMISLETSFKPIDRPAACPRKYNCTPRLYFPDAKSFSKKLFSSNVAKIRVVVDFAILFHLIFLLMLTLLYPLRMSEAHRSLVAPIESLVDYFPSDDVPLSTLL